MVELFISGALRLRKRMFEDVLLENSQIIKDPSKSYFELAFDNS